MRSHRTLIPFVTIALTLAANAVPTSYYYGSENVAAVIGVANPTLSARGSNGKPLSPITEEDERAAPEPKASAAVVIKSKFTQSPGPPPDHPAPKLDDLRKLGPSPHNRPLPPVPKPKEHSRPPALPPVPARNPNRPTTPKSHERVPSNDSTVPNFSRPLTHSPSTSFDGLTPKKDDKNEPGAKTNETAVVKNNGSTGKKVAIVAGLIGAAGVGMATGYGIGEESNKKETETSDSNATPPDPTQTQMQDAGEPSAVKRSIIRSTYQRRISRWESDELE
ncbi:hypothetical protein EV359DRAFT_66640 [Lentinula novae-zelandiae]|nr:hypothetical protein EV359DRAFT_66640 [Lentinula novae-zelandiae]